MFAFQKFYLKNLRSGSALLLLIAFLVLSYCPLRRTIQNLLKGTHETEQTIALNGKRSVSMICMGMADHSSTQLTLPEPPHEVAFYATVLAVFNFTRPQFIRKKGSFYDQKQQIPIPQPIPLYLKNQSFII